MAVPIIRGISVLFTAAEQADKAGKWKPVPNATLPPFYSRMAFAESNGELWLIQQFVVRNSPEATRVSGAISPLDLSNYNVVAESYQEMDAFVNNVSILFPTANRAIDVRLSQTTPVMGFNRSVGVLPAAEIRTVLGIAPIPDHR
jgi:hypothetical protein